VPLEIKFSAEGLNSLVEVKERKIREHSKAF